MSHNIKISAITKLALKDGCIGYTLAKCRKELHLTQGELSQLSDVPIATIANIEQVRTGYPNMETLRKLTNGIKTPLGLFLLLCEEYEKYFSANSEETRSKLSNKISTYRELIFNHYFNGSFPSESINEEASQKASLEQDKILFLGLN